MYNLAKISGTIDVKQLKSLKNHKNAYNIALF